MTINEALGGGMNVESAVVLANAINQFISRTDKSTSSSQTTQIIQHYIKQREKRVREASNLTSLQTNIQAGSSFLYLSMVYFSHYF